MKVELIFFLLSLLYISAVAGESISFVLYYDSHLFFRSGEIGEVGGEKSGTIELINFHSRGGYFELLSPRVQGCICIEHQNRVK